MTSAAATPAPTYPSAHPALDPETITRLNETKAGFDLFLVPGQIFEMRVMGLPKSGDSRVLSGYYNDVKQACRDALEWDKRGARAIGFTANIIDPRLFGRSPNKLTDYARNTTTDADVETIRNAMFDFDPIRPAGVPGTEAELDAARQAANDAIDWLREQMHWPEPVMYCSGNGIHLVFRLDLPNSPEVKQLLSNVTRGLASEMAKRPITEGIPAIKIELDTLNPSRLQTVIGTTKRKGHPLPDAPHRRATIEYVPEGGPAVVSIERLQAVAALAPQPHGKHHPVANGFNHLANGHTANGHHSSFRKADRARSYITKMPGAVQGEKGHDAAFDVALALVKGFDLSIDEARPLFDEYNKRCEPRWSDAEIAHKLESAAASSKAAGYLLHEDRQWGAGAVPTNLSPAPSPQISITANRIPVGTIVRAKDRGNFGRVVFDDGGSIAVYFENEQGYSATASMRRDEIEIAGSVSASAIASEPFHLDVISSAEFATTSYQQNYLIKGILVAGQPGMIGGPHKCLKTSVAIDMAISLGTGSPFLGQFAIPEPVAVAILSGESGGFTLKETATRISTARGRLLASANVFWGFTLPQIANATHVQALADMIVKHEIKVAIIDPAYLCLLSGDSQGRQASNLFDMGSLLQGLTAVCQATGCTIVLLHHTRKNPIEPFAVPSLEDLAFAGFCEWARQWILVGRRRAYEAGTGQHDLWLNVGGSAGHSGTWAVDVDEGVPDEEFRGREWRVAVNTATDAKEQAKEARERKKTEEKESKIRANAEKILAAMQRIPDGDTKTKIRALVGMSGEAFNVAFAFLIQSDLIAACEKMGKNGAKYDGFKLQQPATEREPGQPGQQMQDHERSLWGE